MLDVVCGLVPVWSPHSRHPCQSRVSDVVGFDHPSCTLVDLIARYCPRSRLAGRARTIAPVSREMETHRNTRYKQHLEQKVLYTALRSSRWGWEDEAQSLKPGQSRHERRDPLTTMCYARSETRDDPLAATRACQAMMGFCVGRFLGDG